MTFFFLSSTPSLTNTIYICLPQFFFKSNYGASETQAKTGRLDNTPYPQRKEAHAGDPTSGGG